MVFTNTAENIEYGLSAPLNVQIKILILDDSSFDRLRIKREISQSGFSAQVDEIVCLHNLLPRLENTTYDVVVFDYFLPDGNGEDALKILSQNERNKAAIPVMVSGNPWLDGGSITALGRTISLQDKAKFGSGQFFRDLLVDRLTDEK